jgi:hypothetical protein
LEIITLEEIPAERFPPATAHLSSQTAGRCQDCPQLTAAAASLPVGTVSGRAPGFAR